MIIFEEKENMRKITLAITLSFCITLSFAQKDSCSKYFFKQKESSKTSTVFADTNTVIKTKYCNFYDSGENQMAIAFVKENNKVHLNFIYMHLEGIIPKQKIILGQSIKIAFIFGDSTNVIFSFDSNEQQTNDFTWYNNYVLSDTLLQRLMSTSVSKVELLNPFGTYNESTVRMADVSNSQSKRIINIANCFYNKIKEN